MPIFMPYTHTRRGRALEVWGDVRPAAYALADNDGPQWAEIQFARGSSNNWTTLETVPITDPRGYIDTWLTFPASGSVRIVWTYPPSDTRLRSTMVADSNGQISSRTVSIKIH
jgi:hypothetical protein